MREIGPDARIARFFAGSSADLEPAQDTGQKGRALACGRCRALMTRVLALALSVGTLVAADWSGPKAIFTKRCTGCHTYGHGIKVGPDLKGVTERRKSAWMLEFIRSSSKVIRSGDPTATALFKKFKGERMPDWSDLSVAQVESIIEYFRADGPEQKEPDERNALTSTYKEIATGRSLFHAELAMQHSQRACDACHSVRESGATTGGTLGPDLTSAYWKYQDRALTDFLKHPCTPQAPYGIDSRYLTPQESFDLKAYLAYVAGLPIPASHSQNASGKALSQASSGEKVSR